MTTAAAAVPGTFTPELLVVVTQHWLATRLGWLVW